MQVWARSRLWPAAVLFVSALPCCKVAGSNEWNLRQLHGEEFRHQRQGALMDDFEFSMRNGFVLGRNIGRSTLTKKPVEPIEDPLSECLDNVLQLADFDPQDPDVESLQIQWFSRLAALDPWSLTRERACRELGRAGARIEIDLPVLVSPDDEPPGPAELRELLRSLINAVEQLLVEGRRWTEGNELDLEAACELVAERPLDVQGASEALRAASLLLRRTGRADARVASLLHLEQRLKRICVEQGLAQALLDENARVRGVAVDASTRAAGIPALAEVVGQLGPADEPVFLCAVLATLENTGLPDVHDGASAEDRDRLRQEWFSVVWSLANHPEGAVRAAALRTLSTVSGTGRRNLRTEEWEDWWQSVRPAGPGDRNGPDGTGRPGDRNGPDDTGRPGDRNGPDGTGEPGDTSVPSDPVGGGRAEPACESSTGDRAATGSVL